MINLPKTLDWHFIKSVEDLPKVRKRCLLHVRKYWGSHEEYIDVGELSIGLSYYGSRFVNSICGCHNVTALQTY